MSKTLRAILFAGSILLGSSGSTGNGAPDSALPSYDVPHSTTPVSLLTYNLEGLPWPLASGRQAALARITARLGALRRAGRQPHIVVLQEAFTAEAQAIARQAGYAHAAFGPDAATRPATAGADPSFLDGARWDRGEQSGKWLGSGLIILSDHPIIDSARIAFPASACAGFDCLANKGALIAHLRVPGFAQPVAIVDTHLNARRAAGVPLARSQQAFARQADLLARFVRDQVRPGQALLIGGDMNIGGDAARARSFFAAFSRAGLDFVRPDAGAIGRALDQPAVRDARSRRDLLTAARRRKDWVFARQPTGGAMTVAQAHVPFGSEPGGAALSDHIGYVVDYAPPAPVKLARNEARQ